MSCCRSRRSRKTPGQFDSPSCKYIERSGARITVWPKNQQLMIKVPESQNMVDLAAYLTINRCNGPTADTLLKGAGHIVRAMRRKPAAFLRYGTTGATFVQMLRIADSVYKEERSGNGKR